MATPLKATQLPLFYLPPDDGETRLEGIIRSHDDGTYTAEIAGGWWVGSGTTQKAAIDKAIEAYNREMNGVNP